MKKNILFTQIAMAIFCTFCSSAFAQYWTGDGGSGIRLAVLEPKGKGISENDQWTLSVVQNVIYTDFGKYSAMTIIDRQNLEKVKAEWKESMSGHYSDEDRIKIGELTNASHILNGTVIKTPNAFMLELSITDLQSGERKASYSHPVSASALENHSAIKEASAELLKQLGVNLTGTALGELKQAANITRIQAEEMLARGIVAKRQGTEVAALSYFYQAAALDPSLLEAADLSSVMAANISSGNIGNDTRNKILWHRDWVARLTEAEQFFDNLFKANSLPYTLFYAEKIIPGDINYQAGTQTLSINTNLRAPGVWAWLNSVEKALQAVYDGLDATKMKRDWGLDSWPWRRVTEINPFDSKRKTFSIVAELVNDKGTVIGRANFESRGEWGFNGYGRPQVYISDDDRKQVRFANVRADDITDRITIRIASVNEIDARTAARTGVLRIKAVSEEAWNNYVLFKMGRGGITEYGGKGGDLVIPDSIWNEPVTSIGENVFKHRGITSITIGKNVEVHNNAFDNKFSEFYNKNYAKYGRQRERMAGKYIYHGEKWELAEPDAAEKQREEKEEREAYEQLERQRQEEEKERPERERQQEQEQLKRERQEKERAQGALSIGVLLMTNSIDTLYESLGYQISMDFESSKVIFFRFGLNFDFVIPGIDKNAVKKIYPNAKEEANSHLFIKLNLLARMYPVDALYLSGGAGIAGYSIHDLNTKDDEVSWSNIWTPVLSVGTGLVFGTVFLEGQYNILPFIKSRDTRYLSINIGVKSKFGTVKP
ncbi:MAG: hypothetical protein LBQ87_06935 [Candidatus Fibromonas sp.]|nr:hypothetical protein [Candidatus Fibromonas sp.]